jgi:hypothetical protein
MFVGSSWAQRIDGVNVLVPGQLLSAPFPNHITLNTESGEMGWETSSQESIPEDGFATLRAEVFVWSGEYLYGDPNEAGPIGGLVRKWP